jgi:uncharacterized membrane-anchored protein
MTRAWRNRLLLGAVALQLLVLVGELVGAWYPLWVGQPALLAVEPVDPRSLFRGNYVQLNYRIGRIEAGSEAAALHRGSVAYALLKPDAAGRLQAVGLLAAPPQQGRFIRGRVVSRRPAGDGKFVVSLRYGIEAYFLPRQKANAMERELRKGSIAKIMLAPSGKAALVGVDTDHNRIDQGLPTDRD